MSVIEVDGVVVRILEAIPINIPDKKVYLLSLQIIDKDYVSPIVRKQIDFSESLSRVILDFVKFYKTIKPFLIESEKYARKY